MLEWSIVEDGEHIEGGIQIMEYEPQAGKTLIALAYSCGMEVEISDDGSINTKGDLESIKQFYAELSAYQARREHLENCLSAPSYSGVSQEHVKKPESIFDRIKKSVKAKIKAKINELLA